MLMTNRSYKIVIISSIVIHLTQLGIIHRGVILFLKNFQAFLVIIYNWYTKLSGLEIYPENTKLNILNIILSHYFYYSLLKFGEIKQLQYKVKISLNIEGYKKNPLRLC